MKKLRILRILQVPSGDLHHRHPPSDRLSTLSHLSPSVRGSRPSRRCRCDRPSPVPDGALSAAIPVSPSSRVASIGGEQTRRRRRRRKIGCCRQFLNFRNELLDLHDFTSRFRNELLTPQRAISNAPNFTVLVSKSDSPSFYGFTHGPTGYTWTIRNSNTQ